MYKWANQLFGTFSADNAPATDGGDSRDGGDLLLWLVLCLFRPDLDLPLLSLNFPCFATKSSCGKSLTSHEAAASRYLENGIIICEGYGCSEISPMVSVFQLKLPKSITISSLTTKDARWI